MITKIEEDPMGSHSPTGGQAASTGWAAVENEMLRHDEGTMKGHLGDIDTLLVFAGLFSAVLTAFVVESYQQLQLDTGMGSMLTLRRISVQLESFTLSPGFVNSSSNAPPLPSLEFAPDFTVRWINALWFLSLVFSLAAALFGILVKQWIREYMHWNAALASPRDNVLVRQIRFEAWNKWNVPATIATIPALLEIALVLFLGGLVILLWTLDLVVSIVITAAVGVFLAIASTFTILPAFFERCPYKSPTAWTFAVLLDVITLWIPHAIGRLRFELGSKLCQWRPRNTGESHDKIRVVGKWLRGGDGQDSWRLGNWTAISGSWRARDLADVWSSFAPRSNLKRGDPAALLDALLSEQSCADGGHECTEDQSSIAPWHHQHTTLQVAQTPLHDALRTITELPPLVRALAWVSRASQDVQTQHSVSNCVESLASRFVLPRPMISTDRGGWVLTQEGVRALSIWHLLVSFGCRNELTTNEDNAWLKNIAVFRWGNATESDYPRVCNGDSDPQNPYSVYCYHLLSAAEDSLPAASILFYLSALQFRSISEKLALLPPNDDAQSTLRSTRRAMELLTTLYSLRNLKKNNPYIAKAADCLVGILRATNGQKRELFEDKYPELRESIATVVCDLDASRQLAELLDLDMTRTSIPVSDDPTPEPSQDRPEPTHPPANDDQPGAQVSCQDGADIRKTDISLREEEAQISSLSEVPPFERFLNMRGDRTLCEVSKGARKARRTRVRIAGGQDVNEDVPTPIPSPTACPESMSSPRVSRTQSMEMAVMSGGEVLDMAASGHNPVASSDAAEPIQG